MVRVLCLLAVLCLALTGGLRAHQVPNLTVEAEFRADGAFELRMNLDPRVFLAAEPRSLPPVEASWYLEQDEARRQDTHRKAEAWLRQHLEPQFDGQRFHPAAYEVMPLDGADNTPVKPETAELHLLAVCRGVLPAGARKFSVNFSRDAQVSLILTAFLPGGAEPVVRVVFAGESSPPVTLPPITAASQTHPEAAEAKGWLDIPIPMLAVTAFALFAAIRQWLWWRKKRAKPPAS